MFINMVLNFHKEGNFKKCYYEKTIHHFIDPDINAFIFSINHYCNQPG